jgi:hypothetical protein
MWNPFKKVKQSGSNMAMNMMAKVAMKKMANMSPKEQQKMMAEAFKPENKDKLLSAMEMMKKTGQLSEEQCRMAKERLGL